MVPLIDIIFKNWIQVFPVSSLPCRPIVLGFNLHSLPTYPFHVTAALSDAGFPVTAVLFAETDGHSAGTASRSVVGIVLFALVQSPSPSTQYLSP